MKYKKAQIRRKQESILLEEVLFILDDLTHGKLEQLHGSRWTEGQLSQKTERKHKCTLQWEMCGLVPLLALCLNNTYCKKSNENSNSQDFSRVLRLIIHTFCASQPPSHQKYNLNWF